jgi:hypothetical protein
MNVGGQEAGICAGALPFEAKAGKIGERDDLV